MPTIKIKTNSNTTNTVRETKNEVETNEQLEVLETDVPVTSKFNVPKQLFIGFTNVLRNEQLKFAKQLAEDFGLDYEEVVAKCLPDEISIELDESVTPKKVPKTKKSKLTDFNDAQSFEELKVFKMNELKTILEENDLPISGAKTLLMARVWGINHPDEAPVEPKKKRGRPSKTPNTVESISNDNVEECELDADKMPTIFVESDGTILDDSNELTTNYKLLKDKFVFNEGNEELDFKGIVENGIVTWDEDIPEELIKLLGMEA